MQLLILFSPSLLEIKNLQTQFFFEFLIFSSTKCYQFRKGCLVIISVLVFFFLGELGENFTLSWRGHNQHNRSFQLQFARHCSCMKFQGLVPGCIQWPKNFGQISTVQGRFFGYCFSTVLTVSLNLFAINAKFYVASSPLVLNCVQDDCHP